MTEHGQKDASTASSNPLSDLALNDGPLNTRPSTKPNKGRKSMKHQDDSQNITDVQLVKEASQLRTYKLTMYLLLSILALVSFHGTT